MNDRVSNRFNLHTLIIRLRDDLLAYPLDQIGTSLLEEIIYRLQKELEFRKLDHDEST